MWVIYPLASGKVIIKHVQSKNNLFIDPSLNARAENENMREWESFNIEKDVSSNSFFLVSEIW